MAELHLGGQGSGNFGHKGRVGEVGGSSSDGDSGGSTNQRTTAPEGRDPNPAPASHVVSVPSPETPLGATRPEPILAKDLEHAVDLILKGEVVELKDVTTVHTVLEKLADIAKDAEAKGEKAPDYDLCNVSVAGTNLFCGSSVKTEKFPEGIPRIEMPQLTGKAREGSEADKLPKGKSGGVDAVHAFMDHLNETGIVVTSTRLPASTLKATQAQLVGPTVARMMADHSYQPGEEPIFVSSDGYVLDGHHRWAAVVGRDAQDGVLGQSTMNVRVVDAPITELLLRADSFVNQFGLLPKGAGAAKKTALAMIFDGEVEIALPFREKLLKLSNRWMPEDDGSNLTRP